MFSFFVVHTNMFFDAGMSVKNRDLALRLRNWTSNGIICFMIKHDITKQGPYETSAATEMTTLESNNIIGLEIKWQMKNFFELQIPEVYHPL